MNQLGFTFAGVAEIITREPLRIEVADHYPQPYRKTCFDTLYDGGLDCFDVPPEERATEDGWKVRSAKSGKTFETVNPATGKTIARIAEADAV